MVGVGYHNSSQHRVSCHSFLQHSSEVLIIFRMLVLSHMQSQCEAGQGRGGWGLVPSDGARAVAVVPGSSTPRVGVSVPEKGRRQGPLWTAVLCIQPCFPCSSNSQTHAGIPTIKKTLGTAMWRRAAVFTFLFCLIILGPWPVPLVPCSLPGHTHSLGMPTLEPSSHFTTPNLRPGASASPSS